MRSEAAKNLFFTYLNDKPEGFKEARIEQLAEMHMDGPDKMADELEAMAEILYALEEDTGYDPKYRVLTALVADLAAVLSIQYMTKDLKPGEKP